MNKKCNKKSDLPPIPPTGYELVKDIHQQNLFPWHTYREAKQLKQDAYIVRRSEHEETRRQAFDNTRRRQTAIEAQLTLEASALYDQAQKDVAAIWDKYKSDVYQLRTRAREQIKQTANNVPAPLSPFRYFKTQWITDMQALIHDLNMWILDQDEAYWRGAMTKADEQTLSNNKLWAHKQIVSIKKAIR